VFPWNGRGEKVVSYLRKEVGFVDGRPTLDYKLETRGSKRTTQKGKKEAMRKLHRKVLPIRPEAANRGPRMRQMF